MGPRSYERGNLLVSAATPAHPHASMGPRSYERGNGLLERLEREERERLQWGRVLMNAEIRLCV